MEPPTIGYVVRAFPHPSETFVVNEILGLERLGARIRIFSYRRPTDPAPHESVRLIQAPVAYLPDPLSRQLLQLLRANVALARRQPVRYLRAVRDAVRHALRERSLAPCRHFLQAVCLANLLRGSDVGHLHAHFAGSPTRVAMLASLLAGLPFSFTAHAQDVFRADVDARLLREKIARARFAVTVCRYNKDFLERELGVQSGAVHVVYNGIDLEKFSPTADTERADGDILAVGRLVEKKGLSHLIEACRILRDQGCAFRCEIAGDGPLRAHLEREVRRAGLEGCVQLVGPRTQEELVHHYRRAAVLAMPAVVARDGNRDALPTVLLEAMACGAPVVASHLGGIPEIVDEEQNGLLVPPGDAAALAGAVGRLLDDPALRQRFGAAARAKAERCFDLNRSANELYRLFAEDGRVERVPDEARLSQL